MNKKEYKRMFETRAHRPYYTMANLGGMGLPLKEVSGFGYKNTIFDISKEMNNSAYFEVEEMNNSTDYFCEFWKDARNATNVVQLMNRGFQEASKAEVEAWKNNWTEKPEDFLVKELRHYFNLCLSSLGTMYISNPQHVSPLEDNLNLLLEKNPNRDAIFEAALNYKSELPWDAEDKEIKEINNTWASLGDDEQVSVLDKLVKKYGWFNDIEGDQPFDRDHYRKKIIDFKIGQVLDKVNGGARQGESRSEREHSGVEGALGQKEKIDISEEVYKIGQLIGQLGSMRLWNRYHFMHLRYHAKKILEELTKRSNLPELEYATVDEVEKYFNESIIDIEELKNRQDGYVAYFNEENLPIIVTGPKALELKEKVLEVAENKTVKGNIANKGYAKGRVRIISFSADDYNEQVAAFEKGEILVTGMTRPQIIHLCKKAAAIVTDEGGITSHAAVVSRELGVPCIIATHNATKLLKNGDEVEVDANTGVVTLINK